MIHAGKDYERIQDPAKLIPDDEPVFLIRGQDAFGAAAVYAYAAILDDAGGDPEIVRRAREHAERMRHWSFHKMPDLPKQDDKGETVMADDTPSLADRVAVLEAALQEIAGYSCTCADAFVSRGKVDPDCMAGEVGDTAREALGMPLRCRGLAAEHYEGRGSE